MWMCEKSIIVARTSPGWERAVIESSLPATDLRSRIREKDRKEDKKDTDVLNLSNQPVGSISNRNMEQSEKYSNTKRIVELQVTHILTP